MVMIVAPIVNGTTSKNKVADETLNFLADLFAFVLDTETGTGGGAASVRDLTTTGVGVEFIG
jgi:hypothetical protein